MSFDPMAAAQAFYGTGEIRRRMGNLAGAEESFARAHEIGFEPQPGLALLRLAQGKTEAARTGLGVALAGETGSRMRRARLLGAQVDVALAEGDVETARTASDELDAIAAGYATPALDASAATARGAISLAEGDLPAALESLRHAVALWRWLGRGTPSRCGTRRTRTTPAWSSGRRSPPSNVWGRCPMPGRRRISSPDRPAFRAA
jgi:tetratricopeptide (TPR) repeat protein